MNTPNIYRCPSCGYDAPTFGMLALHMREHPTCHARSDRIAAGCCPECRRHRMVFAPGGRSGHCDSCGWAYSMDDAGKENG